MRPISILILLFISPFVGCGSDTQESDNFDSPTHPFALEINKRSAKSLGDICNDLKKVSVDSWGAVCDERDALGKIALDLEKSLVKPLGEFASRVMLLDKRLIIFIKRDLYLEDRENIINKIVEDARQLLTEINQETSTTPDIDIDKLEFLNRLIIAAEGIINNATGLYKIKIDLSKDPYKLLRNNAYLTQRNLQIYRDNINLVREQKKLRNDLDLAKAKKLLQELIDLFS